MREMDPRRLRPIASRLLLASRVAAVVCVLAFAVGSAADAAVTRDQLAAVFGEDGPASAAVLAAYDEGGFTGAMAAYRDYRNTVSPARLYYMWPGGSGSVRAADRLISEGIRGGSDPAFPIEPPVAWGANPYQDRSWCYKLNNLSWLVPVLGAYRDTGGQGYLTFALEVVTDWHQQNVRDASPNRFAWYDMAVGLRGPVIAFLVDAAARSDAVSDEDLWALLETAARHGQELRDPRKYAGDYNHGLYQMLGLLALGRNLPELKDFPEYRQHAERTAERVLLSSFSREGVHLEHSPSYQLVLLRTLEVVLNQGLVDTPELREIHRLAQEALAWLTHPTGQLAAFGDTTLLAPSSRYLSLDAPNRSDGLLWVLTKGQQGAPLDGVSWVAPEGGYAVFRSTWTPAPGEWEKASYLAMQAGRHSKVHKHADDLTLEWTEFGQRLLTDAGRFKYWYADPRRQYCVSTRAHNTVEIDERDYPNPSNKAPIPSSAITRWTESGNVRVVEAKITHFDTVRHRRTLLFSPAQWLVVVDELSSPDEHTYTQWSHFHPDLDLEPSGPGFAATVGDTGRVLYVRQLAPTDDGKSIMVKGQEEPRLQGWTSLVEGSELVANWALGFRDAGRQATFVTLFTLERGQPPSDSTGVAAEVSSDRIYVTWTQDAKAIALTVDRGEADIRVNVAEPRLEPAPEAGAQARPGITLSKYRPVFRIEGELRATATFTLSQQPDPAAHFFLFLSDKTRFRGVNHILLSGSVTSMGIGQGQTVQHYRARVPGALEAGTYYLQGALTTGGTLTPKDVIGLWSTKIVLVEPAFDHPELATVVAPHYLMADGKPDLAQLAKRVAERVDQLAEAVDLLALPPVTDPLEIARRFLEAKEYPLEYHVATFSPGESFWSGQKHPSDQLEVNSLRMMRYLVRGYDHTGDRAYLDAALTLYADWTRHSSLDIFFTPHTWGEHAVAVRLGSLMAVAARISQMDDFMPEFERLLADIHRHAVLLSQWGFYSTWSNHGMFQNQSLLTAALIFDVFADSDKLTSVAVSRPLSWIKGKVCAEGVVDEGSASYQFIVLDLSSHINAMLNSGGHPHTGLGEIVGKMARVAGLLVKPNGQLWGFGDSWASSRSQIALDRLPDCERDLLTSALQRGDRGVASRDHAVFPDSGYSFLVDDQPGEERDAYLGFDFGVSTKHTHFQDDTGNFELMLRGHSIIEDSGYFDHSGTTIGDYYKSGPAHSTVVFSGDPPIRDIMDTKLDSYTEGPGLLEVAASFQTATGHALHRSLHYYTDDAVLLVRDRFVRSEGEGARAFFHYAPELAANIQGTAIRLWSPEAEFVHHIISASSPGITLHRGQTDPHLGWISRTQGQKEPRWTAEVSFAEAEGELISVFAPADTDIAPYLRDLTKGDRTGAAVRVPD